MFHFSNLLELPSVPAVLSCVSYLHHGLTPSAALQSCGQALQGASWPGRLLASGVLQQDWCIRNDVLVQQLVQQP